MIYHVQHIHKIQISFTLTCCSHALHVQLLSYPPHRKFKIIVAVGLCWLSQEKIIVDPTNQSLQMLWDVTPLVSWLDHPIPTFVETDRSILK